MALESAQRLEAAFAKLLVTRKEFYQRVYRATTQLLEKQLHRDVVSVVVQYASHTLSISSTFEFPRQPASIFRPSWQILDLVPTRFRFHDPQYKSLLDNTFSEIMWIDIEYTNVTYRFTLKEKDIPDVTAYLYKHFIPEMDIH